MATISPAPPVAAAAAAASVAGAAIPAPAGGIQRGSRWTRLKAWFRLAYTDLGSKEHHLLLEWIIWMVIVSVVVTVLQQDPEIDALYLPLMHVLEALILLVFAGDYALNIYFAPQKLRYVFSFSGIVDLLAILPSFLIFFDTSSIKFLRAVRFLRFLRILQVIKALQHRSAAAEEDEENQSLLLDLQLGVIGVSALLLLVPDDALRNLLLMCTLVVAITTGLRRWLVYKQMPALSAVVLLASVIGAMMYSQQLDVNGQPDWAIWFLVGSVLVALITWLRIEGPAGI